MAFNFNTNSIVRDKVHKKLARVLDTGEVRSILKDIRCLVADVLDDWRHRLENNGKDAEEIRRIFSEIEENKKRVLQYSEKNRIRNCDTTVDCSSSSVSHIKQVTANFTKAVKADQAQPQVKQHKEKCDQTIVPAKKEHKLPDLVENDNPNHKQRINSVRKEILTNLVKQAKYTKELDKSRYKIDADDDNESKLKIEPKTDGYEKSPKLDVDTKQNGRVVGNLKRDTNKPRTEQKNDSYEKNTATDVDTRRSSQIQGSFKREHVIGDMNKSKVVMKNDNYEKDADIDDYIPGNFKRFKYSDEEKRDKSNNGINNSTVPFQQYGKTLSRNRNYKERGSVSVKANAVIDLVSESDSPEKDVRSYKSKNNYDKHLMEELICSNCGDSGHSFQECTSYQRYNSERISDLFSPVSDFEDDLQQYKDIYDDPSFWYSKSSYKSDEQFKNSRAPMGIDNTDREIMNYKKGKHEYNNNKYKRFDQKGPRNVYNYKEKDELELMEMELTNELKQTEVEDIITEEVERKLNKFKYYNRNSERSIDSPKFYEDQKDQFFFEQRRTAREFKRWNY